MFDQLQQPEPRTILDQEPPPVENFVERVRFFAKALAYGVTKSLWPPKFGINSEEINGLERVIILRAWENPHIYGGALYDYQKKTWQFKHPSPDILTLFGYLSEGNSLTPEAFALLEEPPTIPDVFISYRRPANSALALLIMSRLQARGIENPFVDMSIDPGDEWHALLEEKVKGANYFIPIIAPTRTSSNGEIIVSGSLDSVFVIQEIQWALEQKKIDLNNYTIIPFVQPGFTVPNEYPDSVFGLEKNQHINVLEESASGYNDAIIRLLNAMGYAPKS